MVSTKSIEVFLALVEHKSIAAVARETYFSQPTVSEYLNQLEKEVDAVLVLRGKGYRQIALTAAGEAFLPIARKWMEQQNELEAQIRQFRRRQNHNTLRLAASSTAHQTIVPEIVCKMMSCCPDITLELRNVDYREMRSAITANAFDIALCYGEPPQSDRVTVIPLFRERQYIICRTDSQLPDRMLTPEDLKMESEVLYKPRLHSERFRKWHDECFPDAIPAEDSPKLEVSRMGAVHNYLWEPDSWAVLPASVALSASKLTYREITPEPPARRCSVVVPKGYREKALIEAFLKCCDELIEEKTYLQKTLPDDSISL